MNKTPDDLLLFPSGLSVSEIKKSAKKLKKQSSLTQTQALQQLASDNGLDLSWEKALVHLRNYWGSYFAEFIYQEEPEYEATVRIGGFSSEEEALDYAIKDGKLIGFNKSLWFDYASKGEPRELLGYEVILRVQDPKTYNNLTVYPHDFHGVNIPINKWQEFIGRLVLRFDSLAWGVTQSPLIAPERYVEKDSQDTSYIESLIYLEAVGVATKARQVAHSLYQVKGINLGSKYNYIHTPLYSGFIMFMLHCTKMSDESNNHEFELPKFTGFTGAIINLEHFDLSGESSDMELFNNVPCYVMDVSLFPSIADLSPFIFRVIDVLMQMQMALNCRINDIEQWVDVEHLIGLIDELELQGSHSEIVTSARELLCEPDYFNKLIDFIVPRMKLYEPFLKSMNSTTQISRNGSSENIHFHGEIR